MYVAVTRAEEKLFLSSAKSRTLYGKRNSAMKSRFVEEIQDIITVHEEAPRKKDLKSRHDIYTGAPVEQKPVKKAESLPELKVGDTIIHKKWGEGMLVQLKGDEGVISFEGKGLKTLKLKVAPIRKKE